MGIHPQLQTRLMAPPNRQSYAPLRYSARLFQSNPSRIGPKPPNPREEQEDHLVKDNVPVRGVINMISRDATDGDSNLAKKRHSRTECLIVDTLKEKI